MLYADTIHILSKVIHILMLAGYVIKVIVKESSVWYHSKALSLS